MGHVRRDALVNGLCIGVALGFFLLGWVVRYISYSLAEEYTEEWLPVYPNDTGLLMHIEYLKTAGNQILLIVIIIGIVLLAVGIAMEVYQRAKEQSS